MILGAAAAAQNKTMNHEFEWFEEDNNREFEEEFNQEFTSNFASSLRRESIPPSQPANKIAELHNDLLVKQQEKYDTMVVKTTKMLNQGEIQKKHLRKTAKALQKELEETRENWQGSAESDAEEISSLRATVTAQKIHIEELEKQLENQPEVAKQKCEKCSFVGKDSMTLMKHKKQAHGQGTKCKYCPLVVADEAKLKKHIEKQHKSEYEFKCEVCMSTFKALIDARDHAKKPCGGIKPKEVVIDIEESDDTHTCNACSISFSSNKNLEEHIEKKHNDDCSKCKATFKTRDDFYNHANNCSEVIAPLMCEKCNIELVSKAGLKKTHRKMPGQVNK